MQVGVRGEEPPLLLLLLLVVVEGAREHPR